MNRLFLFLIFASSLFAVPPDGSWNYRFTNRTGEPTDGAAVYAVSTGVAQITTTINNIATGCVGWQLSYDSEGFSAVSIALQSANRVWNSNLNFSPGTFSTYVGTNVVGSLPLTSTSGGVYVGYGYFPYFNITLTPTGTGSLDVQLQCWKSVSYASLPPAVLGGSTNLNVSGITGTGGPTGSWCPQAATSLSIECFSIPSTLTSGGTLLGPPLFTGNGNIGANINAGYYYVECAKESTTDTLSAATTTAQQTFINQCTIPSSTIIANSVIRVTFGFTWTSSGTPPTFRFQLYLGSTSNTVIYDSNTASPTISLTKVIKFTCLIMGTAAAGASATILTVCGADNSYLAAGTFVFSPWAVSGTTAANTTQATNTALLVVPTMTFSAQTAGNSVTQNLQMVEQVN